MLANTITLFRTFLIIPMFALIAFGQGQGPWWALGMFWMAGVLDMVDGQVARRLNQATPFGALLDIVGDRLLTLGVVFGLIAAGTLDGVAVIAGLILVARDLVVASLNEAVPGKLGPRVGLLEKNKIALAFAGLSLMITAPLELFASHKSTGEFVLWLAAALTLVTVAQYWMRALRAFKES